MEDGGKDTATMTEIHREGVYRGFQKYCLTVLLHVQKHGIFKTKVFPWYVPIKYTKVPYHLLPWYVHIHVKP